MDIVLSSIGLIFLSPLFLLITIGIKMEDKGPVIYKQKRLTIGGREFYVYKFRSMRVDAEQDGVARLACVNDNRVTVVGNFIRKVRLDELPQLFNILKGDMSIVGPRPERPEIAQQYEKEMPEFQYRLRVKAGLTGYAQIYGKYNTTPYDKLKLDLHYIQNYSLLLDIMLIFLTTKILFMKESTEGVTDHQVTAIHVISDEYSDIAEKF
jgi:lipopolysaccharide/colanic/teichoic acid biosynthesis glycosyltransferase